MRNNIKAMVKNPYESTKTHLVVVKANPLLIKNIHHRDHHKSMASDIIIDLQALLQQEPTKKLIGRDNEYRQLQSTLKNSINTFIYGVSGTGKTTLLRKAAIEANSSKIRVIYVDCSLYQTANAILREILIDRPVASRNNYDLLKKLIERTKNNKLIVYLDHIERIKQKDIIDQLIKIGICVVIAGETVECLSELGLAVKASIGNMIELKPYTPDEAVEIVQERMAGSVNGIACSIETITKITQMMKGNMASILHTLKVAALTAQNEKKGSIEAISLNELFSVHDYPKGLNVDERLILQILREWKSLPANRLRDLYIEKSRYPRSERAFRNYMENLRTKSLIKALGETRGRAYEIIEEVDGNEDKR